ncbi:MAG: pilus assembly protein TadG-related protein [Chloroflexota bacterium]
MYRHFHREDKGQTVVLVALMFTMLMGFGALSVDLGRFYAERRFTQTAVDAAALACARAYGQSGSNITAWAAGDALLTDKNLQSNPLGITVTYAAQGSEVYDQNIVAPQNLLSGILPTQVGGVGCRVAVTVDVPTYMIKVLNPAMNTIQMVTRGYAKVKTGFLPSIVQRYANPPGPGNGSDNQFIDHVMAENYDYQCTSTSTAGCTTASKAQPGREFALFGASARASNDNSFRGYIGLDIRDFTSQDGAGNLLHEAYNGVPADVTVNILKSYEAAWILEGYPGPDLCVVVTGEFQRCAQVAVINGASAGIFIDDYTTRIRTGDNLMLQLYDGTVKTVPDFSMSSGTLLIPATGSTSSTVAFTYSSQFKISGATVTSTLLPDDGTIMTTDGGDTLGNPFVTGCATGGTFTANPTPGGNSTYTQNWTNITSTSCEQGIYQAWVRGASSAPYESRVHEALVTINVAGQAKDFSLSSSETYKSVASVGEQANYTIRVTTSNSGSTKWSNPNRITLSWAKCPTTVNPTIPESILTCGIDGSFLTTSVGNVDPGEDHVFNVQTTTAIDGESYRGWVRAAGTDENNRRVTHLLEVNLDVNVVEGGVTEYVDVLGYAVFQVTSITANDVLGRAITGAHNDPNHPELAVGRKFTLVPWETP